MNAQQQKTRAAATVRGEAVFRNQHANHTTASPIEKLLPRLEQVRKTGDRKWAAICPSHADRRPSLSIREADDGIILLRCWSGCGGIDVIEAVGLRAADLFPRSSENRRPLRPGERWIPRDALAGIALEALVVAVAGEQLMGGNPLTRRDLDRIATAAGRLRAAAREVGCHG